MSEISWSKRALCCDGSEAKAELTLSDDSDDATKARGMKLNSFRLFIVSSREFRLLLSFRIEYPSVYVVCTWHRLRSS